MFCEHIPDCTNRGNHVQDPHKPDPGRGRVPLPQAHNTHQRILHPHRVLRTHPHIHALRSRNRRMDVHRSNRTRPTHGGTLPLLLRIRNPRINQTETRIRPHPAPQTHRHHLDQLRIRTPLLPHTRPHTWPRNHPLPGHLRVPRMDKYRKFSLVHLRNPRTLPTHLPHIHTHGTNHQHASRHTSHCNHNTDCSISYSHNSTAHRIDVPSHNRIQPHHVVGKAASQPTPTTPCSATH